MHRRQNHRLPTSLLGGLWPTVLALTLAASSAGCFSFRHGSDAIDAGVCTPVAATACVQWDLRVCTDGHGFDCVICTPGQWDWCEIPSSIKITGGREARAKCVDHCSACTPPESKVIDPDAQCVMYNQTGSMQ